MLYIPVFIKYLYDEYIIAVSVRMLTFKTLDLCLYCKLYLMMSR